MILKSSLLLVCFLLYQITNTSAGTCERQERKPNYELCTENCPLICSNATESEVINAAHGYDKLIVQYGSLSSVAGLFLNRPNLVKILEIRDNENTLQIQELKRPLTQEIDLEELTILNTKLELLYETKLFEKMGKLKKLTIEKCSINPEYLFANLFTHIPNLEYLSLKHNHIAEVESQALRSLHKLKYVDLSENLIKTLSYENFKRANDLEEFYFSRNPLSDFNVAKFLQNKPNLWMANMHSIYCNTFRYSIMDAYQKLGYKPTYYYGRECGTKQWYKCNYIIMKDESTHRNITITEVQEDDSYQTYYESNINHVFMCMDDCSTQLIDYFREDDEYAEQLAASVLQYYMGHLKKDFKDFLLRFGKMEHIGELKASIEQLYSVINVTSLQIEGKL